MKKKILLIEDRISRQELYLSKYNVNLSNIEILKNIKGGQEFIEIKQELSIANEKVLDPFCSVLAHRSALEQSEREFLFSYCKNEKKPLAFFSGGISSVSFYDIDKFQFLSINSSDFYSTQILFFLHEAERNNLNLLHLAFGENWELNLLLNFSTMVNKVRHEKDVEADKIPVSILRNRIGLDNSIITELLKTYEIFPPWLLESVVTNPIERLEDLHKALGEVLFTKIMTK